MRDLLFLHGALGSASQFSKVESLLSEQFNCHHLNFSGHAGEPFASQFGIDAFAQEVQAYLKTHELKQPDVFGYSMGGYVAMYLEANHSKTFRHIMTLGTKFNWTAESAEKESKMLEPDVIEEKVPHYAEKLKEMHGESWKLLVEKSARMMKYLGSLPLLTDAMIQNIHVPVRLSVGDQDKMVSMEETIRVFRLLKKGSFLVMPETPHPIDKVHPDRLAYKILAFMNS